MSRSQKWVDSLEGVNFFPSFSFFVAQTKRWMDKKVISTKVLFRIISQCCILGNTVVLLDFVFHRVLIWAIVKIVLSLRFCSQFEKKIDAWQPSIVHLVVKLITDNIFIFFYNKLVLTLTVDMTVQSKCEKEVENPISEKKNLTTCQFANWKNHKSSEFDSWFIQSVLFGIKKGKALDFWSRNFSWHLRLWKKLLSKNHSLVHFTPWNRNYLTVFVLFSKAWFRFEFFCHARFWCKNFTTFQTLNCKNYNALDFEVNIYQLVRFWKQNAFKKPRFISFYCVKTTFYLFSCFLKKKLFFSGNNFVSLDFVLKFCRRFRFWV